MDTPITGGAPPPRPPTPEMYRTPSGNDTPPPSETRRARAAAAVAEARVLAAPVAARGLAIASDLWGSLSTKASALGAFGALKGRGQTGDGSSDEPSTDAPGLAAVADDKQEDGYPTFATSPHCATAANTADLSMWVPGPVRPEQLSLPAPGARSFPGTLSAPTPSKRDPPMRRVDRSLLLVTANSFGSAFPSSHPPIYISPLTCVLTTRLPLPVRHPRSHTRVRSQVFRTERGRAHARLRGRMHGPLQLGRAGLSPTTALCDDPFPPLCVCVCLPPLPRPLFFPLAPPI